MKNGKEVDVPNFILRSFMYIPHFADALWEYVNNYEKMPKILHISGDTVISWYLFMKEMADIFDLDSSLVKSRDNELHDVLAPRPRKAGLNVELSKSLGLPQYKYVAGIWEMKKK